VIFSLLFEFLLLYCKDDISDLKVALRVHNCDKWLIIGDKWGQVPEVNVREIVITMVSHSIEIGELHEF